MKLNMIVSLVIGIQLVSCTQDLKARNKIHGSIEADEIDLASRIPARVKRILVKPGQKVKAGDLLIEFEDDVIAAKRKQAAAMLLAAESKRDIVKDAVRPEEKEQLASLVKAAQKQMAFARQSFQRAKSAFAEGAISKQQLDEVEFKYQAAKEQFNAAAAKERMGKSGARAEERKAAEALVSQAENALSEVNAYVADISLKAPIDGEVYQILNHEGELVPAGYPVVTLLKLSDLWVTFQIPETMLGYFSLGKEIHFVVPALGGKTLTGSVSFLSAMAGFATKTTTAERGSVDLKTFEIRLSIAAPSAIPADDLRPGMTVLIEKGP